MKMTVKIPKLFRRRKKLRATAARRPLRLAATEFEEMAEPNMKLSRALLIVLVLHVVAVSGIIAFNAIKTHQSSPPPPASAADHSNATVGSTIKPEASSPHAAVAAKESGRHEEARMLHLPGKQVAKEDRKSDHRTDESGKVYVVAKGDNPVTIAKKLKVSYDDLIALNHIEDPR
jgi:hypothetical protein